MRVLVTERNRVHEKALEMLKGFEIDFGTPDNLENLGDYDVVLISVYTKISNDILKNPGSLKAIISCSAGLDHIDLEACKEKGVKVYSAPAANANAVAEHAIGLLFAVLKKIKHADSHIRENKWERKKFMNHEIEGKTAGIIGFGAIGKLVVKKMSGFGVDFIVFDPVLTKEEIENAFESIDVRKVELDYLLKKSDFISIHAPLLESTKNLINKKSIGSMKSTCIIINTSRGGLIDEDALTQALKTEKLYGAGLDVFKNEPLENDDLKALDNVVLTPHIASHTKEAHKRSSVSAVRAFLKDFKE